MNRKVILAVAGVIALAAIVIHGRMEGRSDPAADLLTAQAIVGDIERTVEATGALRPVRLVAVGAQVSGRITAMKVAVGDRVKAGDLVALIDDVTQKNDLASARAAVADLEAQKRDKEAVLAYAEAALARETATLAKAASSKDSYDAALKTERSTRAQIDSLAAQITQAQVKVATAEVNLGYTRITAPIDGTVLMVISQEGQNVNAVQSAPTIVVLGQIDRMRVRIEVSEVDAPRVAVGQPADFTILGDPDRHWEGKLASLEPAPDGLRSDSAITSSTTASSSSTSSSSSSSSAIYYYANFDVPNDDGVLRTYMTAQVRVRIDRVNGVLSIPKDALQAGKAKGERTVDVVTKAGTIEKRTVTIGLDDKVRVEIRSGLSEGERVVVGRRTAGAKSSSTPSPPGGL